MKVDLVRRSLWAVLAVWVVFWSLYPAFGRPAAIAAAVREGQRELDACGAIGPPETNAGCYVDARQQTRAALEAITFRSEYVGYAPTWVGAGVCAPLAVALVLVTKRKRVQAA